MENTDAFPTDPAERARALLAMVQDEQMEIRRRLALTPDWQRLTFLDGSEAILKDVLNMKKEEDGIHAVDPRVDCREPGDLTGERLGGES